MRRRGDEGFTLLEMLLSITLLGLISGPLVGAILLVLQSSSYTMERPAPIGTTQDQLVTAADERLLDAYFGADAQSSRTVGTAAPACASTPSGVSVTSAVAFTWPDSSGSDIDRVRSAWYYVARPVRPDGTPDLTRLAELRRASCTADVSAPSVALPGTERTVVVNRVLGPAAPTLTCDAAASCSPATERVALRVQLGLDSSTTYSVQAHRRLA